MGRKVKDLAGERFGKLTVIRFAGINNSGSALWRCRCDCGNEIVTSSQCLLRGSTTSCGCIRSEAHLGAHSKTKFEGDEFRILFSKLLDEGLRQHPTICEFWCLPTGKVFIIRSNYILEPKYCINGIGYYHFKATVNGDKPKTYYVHRIVAETFLNNPEGLEVINHIDENKLNNDISNLEFCSQAYNVNWSHAKSVRAFDLTTGEWIGDFLNIEKAAQYFRCSRTAVGQHMKCVKRNVRFECIDNYLKSAQREYLKDNDRHDLKYDDVSKEITDF